MGSVDVEHDRIHWANESDPLWGYRSGTVRRRGADAQTSPQQTDTISSIGQVDSRCFDWLSGVSGRGCETDVGKELQWHCYAVIN